MADLLANVATWEAETTESVLDVVHEIERLAEHQGYALCNNESLIRQPTASAAVRACMERIADELDDTQPLPTQYLDERWPG